MISTSMNTTPSRRMAQARRDSTLEITNRLAKAFERLSFIFSEISARRLTERKLKNREMRKFEISYEARKRRLLMALRQKISEKQTKID